MPKKPPNVCEEPEPVRRAWTTLRDEHGINLFHADRQIVFDVIAHELAEQQRKYLRSQGYGLECVCDGCSACIARDYIDLIDTSAVGRHDYRGSRMTHATSRQQDTGTVPDTDHTALREALLVLLSRAARGVLTADEGPLLRQHVEHLLGDRDQLAARVVTLEHVAAGNKRHVQLVVPELERVEAALDRVRAECDAIEAENHGQHDEDADGARETVLRIRAAAGEALPGPAVGA